MHQSFQVYPKSSPGVNSSASRFSQSEVSEFCWQIAPGSLQHLRPYHICWNRLPSENDIQLLHSWAAWPLSTQTLISIVPLVYSWAGGGHCATRPKTLSGAQRCEEREDAPHRPATFTAQGQPSSLPCRPPFGPDSPRTCFELCSKWFTLRSGGVDLFRPKVKISIHSKILMALFFFFFGGGGSKISPQWRRQKPSVLRLIILLLNFHFNCFFLFLHDSLTILYHWWGWWRAMVNIQGVIYICKKVIQANW